ncbi:glycoside hydrolase family 17 protein [Jejuia pallidilutea]|uniref:Endo-1,3-beta-glucanase btgC n=1 Tax=Jejuia pallidilutea TaxID=504487 RepID=A0A090VXI0_9FLAO|nr:glycosyl hydrolase family 17 protein [Jejuia pallidilutea]GAL65354.1 probable glucosyl transferase [Jejuia pallidilutea]GAL69416.1 probable glucosyl transferase [Jejuia pallidilutea]GAL89074.1 probable glucosyl transferase [Jejuia pallidilutea]
MSYRADKIMALSGTNLDNKTKKGKQNVYKRVLENGMHGLCFSPYEEGQAPGDQLTEKQIRRRLKIIKPYTKWVRSFSCTDGNELIPKIAKELGLKTLVGAWLGDDADINKKEIEGLKTLANQGYVDIAAVGNEVMYRGDLTEEELLSFIYNVKQDIPEIPVGYVDAYYEFAQRPKITEACDVILANCYPYWEGCSIEYSLIYMKDMYNQAVKAANGKKVIISETGWPSEGEGLNGAFPSAENAMRYFINTQQWSKEDNIDIFYFSSFDESWKVGAEGDVGAFWGLWDKNENPKFYRKPLVLHKKKIFV